MPRIFRFDTCLSGPSGADKRPPHPVAKVASCRRRLKTDPVSPPLTPQNGNPGLKIVLALVGAIVGAHLGTLMTSHHLRITPIFDNAGYLAAIVLSVLLLTLIPTGKKAPIEGPRKPIACIDSGEPIYPVVGYTPDGKPMTADRVAGPIGAGYNPRTNSFAVVALVCGLLFGPLAIPFGHIARAQIRGRARAGRSNPRVPQSREHRRVHSLPRGREKGSDATTAYWVLIGITAALGSAGA